MMFAPYQILHQDCAEALSTTPDSSIECIVTDPPYGLSEQPDPVKVMRAWCAGEDYHHNKKGFMGAEWDSFIPQPRIWKEALRVLKPGGYALVFAGSRTQDWMSLSLRFAGFEVVDTIMWVYAQGMPKSHNISKVIDKYPAAADEASRWRGWGTQLKPAYEPILVCRKPCEGTFAANTLKHGVGGINIDACRVPIDTAADASQMRTMNRTQRDGDRNGQSWGFSKATGDTPQVIRPEGRWPANLAHDGSEAVVSLFPESCGQQGDLSGQSTDRSTVHAYGNMKAAQNFQARGDTGSAARFFFCAKASTKERHFGVEHPGNRFKHGDTPKTIENADKRGNYHPTVKPIALMRWLVRMVCPPGGRVLDMYCGSGTTGIAAIQEGVAFTGIERDQGFASIANARCAHAWQQVSGEKSERQKRRELSPRRPRRRKYRIGEQMALCGFSG